MAKSHDTPIQDILKGIHNGTTRLPDFQRGWVWDDKRIRALIASITCSYPVGALMFLEYGEDGVRFKSRIFKNVPDDGKIPKMLVLDGQQRLTSIYCAKMLLELISKAMGKHITNLDSADVVEAFGITLD